MMAILGAMAAPPLSPDLQQHGLCSSWAHLWFYEAEKGNRSSPPTSPDRVRSRGPFNAAFSLTGSGAASAALQRAAS